MLDLDKHEQDRFEGDVYRGYGTVIAGGTADQREQAVRDQVDESNLLRLTAETSNHETNSSSR